MGWFEETRDSIYLALCAAFGLDPEGEGLTRFVPAYVNNSITPQAKRDVDVCYFNVGPFQGDSTQDYIMIRYTTVKGVQKTEIVKTVPSTVLVTFYGPHADDDAEKFWSMFQWDSGADSPRSILRKRKVVPIGKPDRPVSLYEVEGTYQRRRSDVRVNLAYLDIGEFEASYIESAPAISFIPQQK